MKPRWSTERLDTLLGRGSIGAKRRDAIIESVVAQVGAETAGRRHRRWSFAGFGALAATAAALFFLVPRFSQPTTSPFRSKGVTAKSTLAMPSVAVECVGATLDACPAGSLLAVRVTGARGYVSAWAEPVGGGERIWYFSADTVSPLVDGDSQDSAIAGRAVKIGPEHVAGTYAVEIRVTKQPMKRDALATLPTSDAQVTLRTLLTVTSP